MLPIVVNITYSRWCVKSRRERERERKEEGKQQQFAIMRSSGALDGIRKKEIHEEGPRQLATR